jgi:C1A family cysteine protease
MHKTKRFGYVPDFGDPRDHAFIRAATTSQDSVDLRPRMTPIRDQGQIGSCTAFALDGAVGFLHGFVGSPLWLYYEERLAEHTTRSDAGAQIRDGIKVLASKGYPPEKEWPYDPLHFAKAPPAAATKDAKLDLITNYQRLGNVIDMRNCLEQGFPFVVGISVYEQFESDEAAETGEITMPGKHDSPIGGHAVCVVGFEKDGRFIVRNSWSDGWGLKGYFHLPHDYLASTDLASDCWTIRA